MAGELTPADWDERWLLAHEPDASVDEVIDFIERVGMALCDDDTDEITARDDALQSLRAARAQHSA